MNEILRAEARTRNAEPLAQGERITLLEAAAATSVATTVGAAPPLRRPPGRPRNVPIARQLPHRPGLTMTPLHVTQHPTLLHRRKRPLEQPRKAPPAVALSLEGEGSRSASRCPR